MNRRVILDECLPARLKRVLDDLPVTTVHEAGFAGRKNGDLLKAIGGRFDVFVTVDKALRHQQNLSSLPFGIILIRAASNAIDDLLPLAGPLRSAIDQVAPGALVEVNGF
jgi:predicted nuclease of predicted toxin-antitoxin system